MTTQGPIPPAGRLELVDASKALAVITLERSPADPDNLIVDLRVHGLSRPDLAECLENLARSLRTGDRRPAPE